MPYRFCLLLLGLFGILPLANAQKPAETKEEYEAAYERRIRQEVLNRVYIPKDLADAFNELNKRIDADSERKFLSLPDTVAAQKLFFSLGRWVQVNWGFHGGSRFSHYLKGIGLSHPEDMATFVIVTYHRNLSRSPLDVKALVEELTRARRQLLLDRKRASTTILLDTTIYSPPGGGNR